MTLPEAGCSPEKNYLLVRAAGMAAALPIRAVRETCRVLPIHPLAGLPEFVRGTCLLRGRSVPVVDLGQLLSGSPTRHPTRLVSVIAGELPVALLVEQVDGVVSLDEARVAPLAPLLRGAGEGTVERLGALDRDLPVVMEASRIVPDRDRVPGSNSQT